MRKEWDSVAANDRPSWYLDPLVAKQKRRLYRELVRDWTRGFRPSLVLKTDLFEEAYGEDHLLYDLLPQPYVPVGIDLSVRTVARAHQKNQARPAWLFATDVRRLGLATGTLDLILSNSTLDHFATREEFTAAVAELARVLRPGGRLVIALDNPMNPLYFPLRWLSSRRAAPFPLGHTTTLGGLARSLEAAGLEVHATGCLIHNPRIVSTLLFLGLRRLLGRRADAPIGFLLKTFAQLGRLPTRRLTACFIAACAQKPCGGSTGHAVC